jgi:hypothetical protein
MVVMSAVIEISDREWALVEDRFDPPGRVSRGMDILASLTWTCSWPPDTKK